MGPSIHFTQLQIDGKKLTVGLFRQLPIEALCDQRGVMKQELNPFGIVRYKHQGVSLWALAVRKNEVIRCPLNPTLKSNKELEESLAFWLKSAQAPHNQGRDEDSVSHRQVEEYTLMIAAEPDRYAVHMRVAQLEQVFL